MSPHVRSILHALSFLVLLGILYLIAGPLDVPDRVIGSYEHTLVLDIGIAITLAVSLNLILGIAGQFSIGHAGFVAAGAYTSAAIAGNCFAPLLNFFMTVFHVSAATGFNLIMVMGMIAGAIVAAVMGLLVGLPTLRLRGDYLAIATLGFGEILAVFIQNTEFLGASTGLSLSSMHGTWISDQIDAKNDTTPLFQAIDAYHNDMPPMSMFAVFGVALLTIYIVHNIKYATSGRALLALREDPIASESVGVPTTRYKVVAFVIGAALAGLAGGLVSHEKPLINPEAFRFMRSIEIVAMVILGGQGSITGSILAATLLTLMPVALRDYITPWISQGLSWLGAKSAAQWVAAIDIEKWRMVLYSLFIIIAMLFMPRGLFGRYEITDLLSITWQRFKALPKAFRIGLAAFLAVALLFLSWPLLKFVVFELPKGTPLTAAILFGNGFRIAIGLACTYAVLHLAIFILSRWFRVSQTKGTAKETRKKPGDVEIPPGVATLAAEGEAAGVEVGDGGGEPLLQASNVTMQFGGLKAVDNFSLKLMPGELVGLIGPNGAGKTTVFNVLTGVYRPTKGDIAVGGGVKGLPAKSIVRLKPNAISRRGVARTFQNIRLFGNLSVIDNVQIAQHAHHKQGIPASVLRIPGFYREEAMSRTNALGYLDLFGLAHLAEERANSLSYGDQRRLEIARALATRPRVLLLDEPAAGMNPTEKRELMEMIQSLRSRFGLTILLIEHDMKVIMGICQRILVLDYGKTIAAGSPAEIRQNPAVIEAYLGTGAKH